MKSTAEYLLSFLANAGWQLTLIAAMAAVADIMMRRTAARYRHLVWVTAVVLSLTLPLATSVRRTMKTGAPTTTTPVIVDESAAISDLPEANTPPVATNSSSGFQVGPRLASALLGIFLMFLGYRAVRLLRAWVRTREAKRHANPFDATHRVHTIVAECRRAIGAREVTLMNSASLSAPATVGVSRPLIILPEILAREANDEELTAAIGHELVHVWRRDYLLNLIYELIFLPLSFHPAAVLMRRRITQTRELRCDELVTELLLQPEVYARSLVQLAHSALPRRARTVAVGIADADILEVRVMSLLKKTGTNSRKKRVWLIVAALLLALPCVAAAAFAFHLNINAAAQAQEPSREDQEKRLVANRRDQEMKEKMERQVQELEEGIQRETNADVKAKLEKRLEQLREQMDKAGRIGWSAEGQNYVTLQVDQARAREEQEQERKRQAILAQAAQISMDRAIQIATSQQPGKVLESSLVGEHWQGEADSAKPSLVLYHVVILSNDGANPVTYHVLVNATDGSIWRSEKEERKRENPEFMYERRREPIKGGVLNGKAISLPAPEYPEIAKNAKADGSVTVQVTIDETGHIIEARATSGHPLLQAAAVAAARQAVFTPTRLEGEPVKVSGAIIYNFVAQ